MINIIGVVIFAFIFTTVVGLFLNASGFATFTFLNPVTFLVGQGLLMVAVGLSNTPVAKGVALAVWGAWIFTYLFSLNIPDPIGWIVYTVILIPTFIAIGMVLLEIGKG